MAYPAMPPKTEAMVHNRAIPIHCLRAAKTIGINKISGGIGKKELSINEKKPNAHFDLGWVENFMTKL